MHSDLEIDEKCQRVHDRGNKGAGHHGRVKAELLGQQRHRAADELGQANGGKQRDANGAGHQRLNAVKEYYPLPIPRW